MLILTFILFIITYILMLSIPKYKSYIALIMAVIFTILGIVPLNKVLSFIDYNVLMIILGTMGTVNLFIESNAPTFFADKLIKRVSNSRWIIIILCLFSAFVSAFVDNVATVLMIVPITLVIAKRINISPVPIVISVAIFSNLEGAATLVGDTTSLLLAKEANMNFMDFMFYGGKIGLFFIVQFAVIFACIALYILMKDRKEKINLSTNSQIKDYTSTITLILTIVTLIIASFIPNKIDIFNGLVCMIFFILTLIIEVIKNKDVSLIKKNIKELDYETVILLSSIFIIIGGVKEVGGIDLISNIFLNIGNNTFIIYTLVVLVSVFVSAFIDNIPYMATMLPVITLLSSKLGIDSTILYYGLIVGSTLGGNFTPIGASANITALGILKKEGYNVSLKEYLKLSIPLTMSALVSGYIIILLLFI